MTLEIRAERPVHTDTIDVYVFDRNAGPFFAFAEPVTMRTREGPTHIPPALSLQNSTAQQLMDELWRCGLRPSEGSGSAGSLAATECHLTDMRALAFAALKVPKP
jgi:hypothetical protein